MNSRFNYSHKTLLIQVGFINCNVSQISPQIQTQYLKTMQNTHPNFENNLFHSFKVMIS